MLFMKKSLLIFLMIVIAGCARNIDKNPNEILIYNGNNSVRINAEIADDNNEIKKGLMFRKNLGEKEGMLFMFTNEEHQTFWMKNTLIPLDIIFIDKSLKIIDIKNAAPCKEEPCPLHKSSGPAMYALEVNGNFSVKNSIKIGDKVKIING